MVMLFGSAGKSYKNNTWHVGNQRCTDVWQVA